MLRSSPDPMYQAIGPSAPQTTSERMPSTSTATAFEERGSSSAGPDGNGEYVGCEASGSTGVAWLDNLLAHCEQKFESNPFWNPQTGQWVKVSAI